MRKRFGLLALMLCLASAAPAQAELTPYTFIGTTTGALPGLETGIQVGDPFTMTFLFDPAAMLTQTITAGTQTITHWTSPNARVNGTVGNFSFSATVTVVLSEGPTNSWTLQAFAPNRPFLFQTTGDLTADPIAGVWQIQTLLVSFRDTTGQAFSSPATVVAPVFEAYSAHSWFMTFYNGGAPHLVIDNYRSAGGAITSIHVSLASLLSKLASDVVAMNIRAGISNALDAKLSAVIAALDDERAQNDGAAVNAMRAFISSVEAQRGKSLTNAQADYLVGAAQGIIAGLGG